MQSKSICNKFILVVICLTMGVAGVSAQKNRKKSHSTTKTVKSQKEILESKIDIEQSKDSTNQKLVSLYNEAMNWLKTPYRRGGTSEKGMDCSGLTGTIYKNVFGVTLQRRSTDIANVDVKDVNKSQLKPGDLVFFSTSRGGKRVNHVGVFLGNRQFIHASTSNGVIISNLDEAYYQRTWVKGGRVVKTVTEKTNNEEIPRT